MDSRVVIAISLLLSLWTQECFCRKIIFPKGKPKDTPFPPPFDCPTLPPPHAAINVRELHPGNIKVVMTCGDSITAGFAMQGYLFEELEEWRGYVYSIGGESDAYTIPNFLSVFNPNIQGTAQGNTWPLTKGAWLDAGVSMARVQDVPDQITYLVNTMKSEYASSINFEEDWKLLTIFIGANNLCGACRGDSDSTPEYFEEHLRAVLTQVEQQIPRVFVNLITIFNISGVWWAGQTSLYCRTLWDDDITANECGCLTTGKEADRQAMDSTGWTFNSISEQLAAEFEAHNNPNFTVVVQPGISGLPIAVFGEDYLSALDCFHPNLEANEAFTYSIWNNMLTPQGQKLICPDIQHLKILCPTNETYIQ